MAEVTPASASRGETPPRDAPVLDAAQRALAELATGPKAGRSDYGGTLSLHHAAALHDEMTRLRAALSASQRAREESRADTERLNWTIESDNADTVYQFSGGWYFNGRQYDTPRAAIDAARAALPLQRSGRHETPANG